jgi:hypothetical protein
MSMPKQHDRTVEFELMDDFYSLNTVSSTGLWTSINDGATGTLALSSTPGAGGWVNIPSAAADNDYQVLATNLKLFKFAASKPLAFEARVTLTEANTSAANFIVGLSSITTTGVMAADGGGVAATFDGAVFYKADGGTAIKFITSAATAQVTNSSVSTFTSAATYRLGFVFSPADGTTGQIIPYVNGVAGTPHNIALASLGLMYPIVGVKAGSASAETLTVDYLRVTAFR